MQKGIAFMYMYFLNMYVSDVCGLYSVYVTVFMQKLRHLAHRIAAKLNINYFDIHNSSKHRILLILITNGSQRLIILP